MRKWYKTPMNEGSVRQQLVDDGVEMTGVSLHDLLADLLQVGQIVFL